jgi:hypothetical protein
MKKSKGNKGNLKSNYLKMSNQEIETPKTKMGSDKKKVKKAKKDMY